MKPVGDIMLGLAAQNFPASLLPPGGRPALKRLGYAVTGSSMLLYECRLGEKGSAVDLSTRYDYSDEGGDRLHQLAIRMAGGIEDTSADAWQSIGDFAAHWRDDPLLSAIATVYLEFDCDGDGHSQAAPAIFLSIEEGLSAYPEAAYRGLAIIGYARSAIEQDLSGYFRQAKQFDLKVDNLLGVMLSRDGELRFMLRARSADGLQAFLNACGWPGDIGALIDQWQAFPCPGDQMRLVLGYADGLIAPYGFEIFLADDMQRSDFTQWLGKLKPKTAASCAALEEWSGGAGIYYGDTIIPEFLAASQGIDIASAQAACAKNINHFKLNYEGSSLSEVKAYLALGLALPKSDDDG